MAFAFSFEPLPLTFSVFGNMVYITAGLSCNRLDILIFRKGQRTESLELGGWRTKKGRPMKTDNRWAFGLGCRNTEKLGR